MSSNSNHQSGGGRGWDNYKRGSAPRRGDPPPGRFHGGNNRDHTRYHPRYNRPYYQRRENDQRTYGHDGRLDTYNAVAPEVQGERGGGYHKERHYHDYDNNHHTRRYDHDDRTRKKPKMEDIKEEPTTDNSTTTNIINDNLRNVNMENWNNFSDRERFESQYPGDFRNYVSMWSQIEKHNLIEFDRMLSTKWLEHKKNSAEIVINKHREDLRKKQLEDQEYESDSSCDEMSMFVNGARPIGAPDDYDTQLDPGFVKFMKSLPFNVIFDVGFHVIGVHPKDEESCFCPCSKMKMIKWRTNFGVEQVEKKVEKDECSNKVYTPKALMDHLLSIGTYLHRAIHDYLEIVYKEFWDYKTSHKALYKVGTLDYNRAEAAKMQYFIRKSELEKQRHHEETEKLRKAEEEMKKRLSEFEKLKVQNEELYTIKMVSCELLDLFSMLQYLSIGFLSDIFYRKKKNRLKQPTICLVSLKEDRSSAVKSNGRNVMSYAIF